MNNLKGRKVKGFKFKDRSPQDIIYIPEMDSYIGRVGVVTDVTALRCYVEFDCGAEYEYPLSRIEKHLVSDIPEIGEGVFMEVSDDEDFKNSYTTSVLGTYKGAFLCLTDNVFLRWKYARPIQHKVTLTKQEIADKFGYNINQLIIEK